MSQSFSQTQARRNRQQRLWQQKWNLNDYELPRTLRICRVCVSPTQVSAILNFEF